MNILYIDVTPEVSHAPMSWLKAEADQNIECIAVTPEVSHAPRSWLKAEAIMNIWSMFFTLWTAQSPMSWLNDDELSSMPARGARARRTQVRISAAREDDCARQAWTRHDATLA